DAEDRPIVEGVAGAGDDFMVGRAAPAALPEHVLSAVHSLWTRAVESLGPIRFEWVCDSRDVWIVQLHRGRSASSGSTIYPGAALRDRPRSGAPAQLRRASLPRRRGSPGGRRRRD